MVNHALAVSSRVRGGSCWLDRGMAGSCIWDTEARRLAIELGIARGKRLTETELPDSKLPLARDLDRCLFANTLRILRLPGRRSSGELSSSSSGNGSETNPSADRSFSPREGIGGATEGVIVFALCGFMEKVRKRFGMMDSL